MALTADATAVAGVGAIVLLTACSAFFSSSEIAIFSIQDHKLEALVEAAAPGSHAEARATTLERLRSDPHRLLVTILVGNNVVNIAIASIATGVLIQLFPSGLAVTISTLLVSVVVLVFGEITPKSYAVANAESWALRTAGTVAVLQRLLGPLVWVFDRLTRVLGRATGGSADYQPEGVTREEVASLMRRAADSGAIEAGERTMIERVFELSTTPAREVMVPRVDVAVVDAAATVESAMATCAGRRLLRVPVARGGSIDDVIGYLDVRDLADEPDDAPIAEFVRPVYHAYEGREIDDLLADLGRERVELAVVIDEFGTTEGVLELEDIVEEIVGEVFADTDEPVVVRIGDRTVRARGRAPVEDVNAALGITLPIEPGVETVAGLVYRELGRPAHAGETVELDGTVLTVQATRNRRILAVQVARTDAAATDSGR